MAVSARVNNILFVLAMVRELEPYHWSAVAARFCPHHLPVVRAGALKAVQKFSQELDNATRLPIWLEER